jgi:hypothetical protein
MKGILTPHHVMQDVVECLCTAKIRHKKHNFDEYVEYPNRRSITTSSEIHDQF